MGLVTVPIADVRLNVVSVATMLASGILFAVFFTFFRASRFGVAMRATAFDQEAALAVGIPVRRVYAWSWMIAGATATVAGVFLAAFPSSLSPSLGFAAFRAFPAAIVGGLDSPGGAILGGLAIGVIEVLVQAYQPLLFPALGTSLHVVTAYVLMIAGLMVRPYGPFGTRRSRTSVSRPRSAHSVRR